MPPSTEVPTSQQAPISWHHLHSDAVLEELNTTIAGLSTQEVITRVATYGLNSLPVQKPPSLVKMFLLQFLHPLIYILLIAALASLVIGKYADMVFIVVVILINSILGGYQEWNAERNASSLHTMLKVVTRVRRDDKELEINSTALVPGDIVLIESGNKIAADMRIISSYGLSVDESFLTGESMASEKKSTQLEEQLTVTERKNMLYAGSSVLSGRGMGVVVATGIQTEVGKIAQNVSLVEATKPPLIIRMERFTTQISYVIFSLLAVLAGFLLYKGYGAEDIFFSVVALAVSAIPAGLPVALTIALSIATSRMAKRHVVVRKLNAVESLGSCTVIASDKTGTLTVNQQTVRHVELANGVMYTTTGEGYVGDGEVVSTDAQEKKHLQGIIEVSVLANEGYLELEQDGRWTHYGDSMDVALLALSFKAGVNPEQLRDTTTIIDTIPYESEKKYSGVLYQSEGRSIVGIKGAVETILEFCTSMMDGDIQVPLNKQYIEERALELARKGYRVLAVARGATESLQRQETYSNNDIPACTLLGLVGFIDPLRPEVRDAIATCHHGGVKVRMITGDHPATAASIGKELHMLESEEEVVTGTMIEEAYLQGAEALDTLVASAIVFARVSPVQKMYIVESLRRQGEFVAVTGDGVNDAPAMRSAHIGVAMGSGTDVAKETGSMIIIDDNFSSIVAGVEEGRFAYDNVRKVILLLISTGAAEVMLFVFATAFGLPLPLLAIQILWLNLVTNGIQDVALAFEGGEPGAMERKPRSPKEPIFNALMIQQTLLSGLTMSVMAFGMWYYTLLVLGMEESVARNIVLLFFVFMQNVHVFNCRSERVSALRVPLGRNPILIMGVVGAAGLHIGAMYVPFMQHILHLHPVEGMQVLQILFAALGLLIVMEVYKALRKAFYGTAR